MDLVAIIAEVVDEPFSVAAVMKTWKCKIFSNVGFLYKYSLRNISFFPF